MNWAHLIAVIRVGPYSDSDSTSARGAGLEAVHVDVLTGHGHVSAALLGGLVDGLVDALLGFEFVETMHGLFPFGRYVRLMCRTLSVCAWYTLVDKCKVC
jgi:branched-subunit amino acid ABC-type transport system permease component